LLELRDVLDLILEVRDARAPMLTMSPISDNFPKSLAVWYILSKADLADADTTSKWVAFFKGRGRFVWALDLRREIPLSLKKSIASIAPSSKEKRNYREVRVAVAGTPNVGKSTLLNRLVGRRAAVVGGVPGVTKGLAWFKGPGCIVADSPGILDPRSDASVHRMLSWIASSKGEVIGAWDEMACECIDFMKAKGLLGALSNTWNIDADCAARDLLERVGRRLGKLRPGGEVDFEASGRAFIDAVSSGRLGRFSLESPSSPE
jgi:ribosome biogenesis GTPase A